MVNLKQKTVLPGFYDGHSHFMRAGLYDAFYLDLSAYPVGTARTMGDIAARVKDKTASLDKGRWVAGVAYDDTAMMERRHFTLAELDAMAPDHPIFLRHVSGHLGLANSAAFAIAGITGETPDPLGGCFRRDGAGNLSGLVEEPAAMDMITNCFPPTTMDEWVKAAANASAMYAAKGVTTAQDGGASDQIWGGAFEAHRRGALTIRLHLLPRHGSFTFSRLTATKPGTLLTADGLLALGALKLFQDGSIQGYTGYLTNPYHKVIYDDLPDGALWRGYSLRSRHSLSGIVTEYHMQGWQIAVHGNGDAAIDDILDAFEQAQKAYPRADARHIIIHCQTVREDQLDRIRRLGVVPSFFVVHTYYWGDRHRELFLGPARAERINPLRSARKRGIVFSTHNDTYVTPIDPLLSVWSAVNRLTSSGNVLGKEQTISVVEALRSITTWAAWQYNEEHNKGSLEPGKLADMVVLDDNPLTAPLEEIKDIPILATLVGNKVVYGTV
jgi:predicted amidohydrolase YtcJ